MERAGCAWSAYSRSCNARWSAHAFRRSRPAVAEIAPGAFVAPGAQLAEGVQVQEGAVIRDGVVLGADSLVESGAVLGKHPRLRARSSASSAEPLGPLVLEAGVTVCCGAVLYAGATIGAGAILGDQCQVRERATVGPETVVGRGS